MPLFVKRKFALVIVGILYVQLLSLIVGREGERERKRGRGGAREEVSVVHVRGCLVFGWLSAVVCCPLVKGGLP